MMEKNFTQLEKNNFWSNDEKIPCGFFREIYQEKISPFLGKKIIKVLVGQRRVGKSYIMRQTIKTLYKKGIPRENIFYLNKESIDFESIKDVSQLEELYQKYLDKISPKGKKYIFIDEVQEIEGWEKFIVSYSENEKDDYEVFITGSNAYLLSGELATYVSGRYIPIEIFPFIYTEYLGFLGKKRNRKTYLEFLKTGGLPFLHTLENSEDQQKYVDTIKNTILLKDIIQRHNIKKSLFLEHLFLFLADNIGNIFSVQSLVSFLSAKGEKVNHELVSNYLSYLIDSFLIYPVDRYDLKGKKILEQKKKYYVTDVSFTNFLLPSFDPFLGRQLENALYIYFRVMGYKVFVGDMQGKEIDFILERGKQKEYVQVTHSLDSQKVIEREFGNLECIKDFYPKKVISLDEISFGNKEGIEHIVAWEM